jgi:hypothetical protein
MSAVGGAGVGRRRVLTTSRRFGNSKLETFARLTAGYFVVGCALCSSPPPNCNGGIQDACSLHSIHLLLRVARGARGSEGCRGWVPHRIRGSTLLLRVRAGVPVRVLCLGVVVRGLGSVAPHLAFHILGMGCARGQRTAWGCWCGCAAGCWGKFGGGAGLVRWNLPHPPLSLRDRGCGSKYHHATPTCPCIVPRIGTCPTLPGQVRGGHVLNQVCILALACIHRVSSTCQSSSVATPAV